MSNVFSQQLIINELSQGVQDAEYVEFLVVDDLCSSNCLDLRKWIFDDNNGIFGSGFGKGIAPGAMRFADIPFWECVTPGTLIVVYNEQSPHSTFTTTDTLMNDGNCQLIIPAGSHLFDHHPTQPNSTTNGYSTTGWIRGGYWFSVAMNNTNDSYQIYDPSNMNQPVFAVSWGNNNSMPQHYINGSVSGTTLYNTGTFPANYVKGSVGTDDSPGTGNSNANSQYIAQLSNNCTPKVFLKEDTIISLCDADNPINLFDLFNTFQTNGGWSGPSNLLNGHSGLFDPQIHSFGTYHYTSPNNGCFDSLIVTINSLGATLGKKDFTINICGNDTVDLLGIVRSTVGSNGSWNGPSLLTNDSLGTFNPIFNASGVYEFVTTQSTCGTDTAAINVIAGAISNAGQDHQILLCSSDAIVNLIDSVPGTPSLNGKWVSNTGVNSTNSTFLFDPSNIALGEYFTYVVGGIGCAISQSVLAVSVNTVPDAGLDNTITGCSPSTFNLFDSLLGSPQTFGEWYGPSNLANGHLARFDAGISTDGTYKYVVKANGCPSDSSLIMVNSAPLTATSISTTKTDFCKNDVPYTFASSHFGSWKSSCFDCIDSLSGVFSSNASNSAVEQIIFTPNGSCFESDTLEINISDTAALQELIFPKIGCSPLSVNFDIRSATNVTDIVWDFGDGFNSNISNVKHVYTQQGCHDISVSATNNAGCVTKLNFPDGVCIKPKPIADFSIDEVNGLNEFDFINNSSNYTNSAWSINQVDSFFTENLFYQFPQKVAQHEVCLLVSTGSNCADTVCELIEVSDGQQIYVPTAFSPNEDGINDVFKPTFSDPDELDLFELSIFNRWGNVIYDSKKHFLWWDGSFQGRYVQEGTYVWKLKYRSTYNAEILIKHGTVNVVRSEIK